MVTCDGPGAARGNHSSIDVTTQGCKKEANFSRALYQCIYCGNRDFCEECLALLRHAGDGARTMVCNATHRWLRIPAQGEDTYVGLRAKKARIPLGARPWNGDPQIIEVFYDADGGGEEITVDAWKEGMAREWDISIEAIQREMSTEGNEGASERGQTRPSSADITRPSRVWEDLV